MNHHFFILQKKKKHQKHKVIEFMKDPSKE